MSWIRQFGEWVAAAAAFLGPGGVFLIALSDSAFIPMPQGVDAILAAQAIASPGIAYLAAACGVGGSLLGSVVLYLLGRRAGQAVLLKRLSPDGARRLGGLVGKWGAALLVPVTAIPLPLPMKPVVLAAGIFQMPLPSFCLAIALSRCVRYFGIVFLAMRFGDRALELASEHAHVAMVGLLLCAALLIFVHRFSNRWLDRKA